MKKQTRHHITFLDAEDLEVAVRGALGQSTKAIQAKTSLTPCQITYRLHKANIRRMDYRNGESSVACEVRRTVGKSIAVKLQRDLSKLFT
jgi:hypothetical protein